MSTLFKKVTATAAALSIVLSIVSPVVGVKAADASLEAANRLAALGVIVDSSANPSAYNLGSSITRREMLKVMMNLSSVEVSDTCEGKFSDLPASDWGCKYAEAALKAGFIAANPKFRPNDLVTEAEALKMIMQARGVAKTEGVTDWAAAYADAAVKAGILAAGTTVSTTVSAKRSMVFVSADSAVTNTTGDSAEGSEDDLDGIFDGIFDEDGEDMEEGDTTDEDTTDEDTTTLPTGDLEVSLNPASPDGADLPAGADGVHVLSFDLTAGSTDAALTDLTFERTGFGEDAAKAVYLFTDSGRVSKSKTFNSDDEANVTISPALVVKAGATVTVKALVDTDSTEDGEFSVVLKTVNGDSVSGVVSDKFDVKSTDATVLNFNAGSVDTSITAGEVQADVAEFDLENDGNVPNSDISVSSITLKEQGTISEEYLDNLTLVVAGDEVATASMNGKYVTFNLDTPVVIKDGKTTTFTVQADILGGAGDDIKFVLDADGDIVASASKYTGVNVVNNYAGTEVDVEAGELTLYAIDATKDEVRDDTDNVVLGQLKLVNVAGQNLELKNLGVALETTYSGVLSVLENVQLLVNGSSYDLDANTASTTLTGVTFSETDLDIVIPQGTTVFTIIADTLDDLRDGETVSMTLDATDTDTFKVEETDDDTVVDDVTPSSLSWDDVEISQPEATVSKVSLAPVTVVKGSSELTALQFEVKANSVSDLSMDKVVVNVSASGGTATEIKDYVSAVSLYKGAVSASNLLDSVNGTKIAGNGNVTFDGFNTTIATDATETFIVVVSTVDTDSAVDGKIQISLPAASQTYLSIEDDNNDDAVFASATGVTGKLITLTGAGQLILNATGSTDNTDNEQSKTILAGSTETVFSIDAKALNESIDIEKMTVTFSDSLDDVVASAKLYLGTELVATATNSDISGAEIVFDDMTKTIVPTTSTELKIALVTEAYGFEKVNDSFVSGVSVQQIEILKDDAKGTKSNEKISDDITQSTTTFAKDFAIVPGVVTPAVSSTFATDDLNATLTLVTDFGSNTDTDDGSSLTASLSGLVLEVSSYTSAGTVTVFNGAGDEVGSGAVSAAGTLTISIDDGEFITSGEIYRLETTAEASFRLAKAGVQYVVDGENYSTNLKTTQNMGTYAKSN